MARAHLEVQRPALATRVLAFVSQAGPVERYGLAVALALLALAIRGSLPVPQGTTVYQLPLAAVVLSAWFGGRGPGLLAVLVCAAGILYWLLPPADSFRLPPDSALGFGLFLALGLLLSEFSGRRRSAENALRTSEERFRTLLQFSFDVYWETDARHRFTRQEFSDRVSDAPAPNSEIGKTRWEVPYLEPDEEAWREHRAILDAHLPFRDFELARPAPDGGKRYVSVSGMPVFDGAGRFAGYRGVGRHITERKRVEAELRARQELLDLAQKAARAVAFDWYIGARESKNRWSPELEAMYGQEPGSFDGTYDGWKKLLHPGDWPEVKAAIGRAQGSGDIAAEYRVVHKDGSVHWLRAKGRMFFDAGGKPERMVGFMFDITDRRHAEEALRASEAYLAEAQRLSHTGSWAFDVALNRYVYTSEESDRIFGFDPNGEKPTREAVFERIHPEDRNSWKRNLEKSLRENVDTFDEYRVVLPDGSIRHVHTIRHPVLNGAGEVVKLVGSSIDITERKHAEEELRASEARFRTFVDHATDAFFLLDDGFTVVDVNRQACESLGRTRDELIGMPPRQFDAGLDEPAIAQLSQRVAAGETITFETRHRRSDGVVFPVEIRSGMFEQGGRRHYLALVRDISERKLAEETLREKDNALQMARTELARVSRLTTLGELTTSIAHEVSQPLGAMMASAAASARWLAATPPDIAEARAAIDTIVADGRRAREVIARVRTLTKRQVPQKGRLDINRELLEVIAITDHELHSHDIVLRAQLDRTLPEVTGDRVQLQQVLLNLILNAVEAMSGVHDRPRQLTIVSRPDDGNAVVVEVRDSGAGIEPCDVEQVFDAFYTTKAEGLGIGLSISRSIVEAHGGRLWAGTNEPRGAVFRFSLPVAEESPS